MTTGFLSNRDGQAHVPGAIRCPACMDGYPTPCWFMECPGGLMHAHSAGTSDGKPVIEGRCETCGRDA
jgi:hypothetical protein